MKARRAESHARRRSLPASAGKHAQAGWYVCCFARGMSWDAVELEHEVHECLAAGDASGAASVLFRALGPEIAGYLAASCRDGETAREAYARTQEATLRGLSGFDGRSSLRTWLYVVARSQLVRVLRDDARRTRRLTPLDNHPEAWDHAAPRPTTQPSTSRFDELRRLRALLSEEDREILVLRVERDLPWDEVARVFAGESADPSRLKREASRLRKRFQAIRDRVARARSEVQTTP